MIRTARMDLIPATLELLRAELAGPEFLAPVLGAEVPEGWPPGEYDRGALEFFRSRLEAEGPAAAGWYTWYAVVRNPAPARGMLVAAAGFFGPPRDGLAEIGYSVIPAARNRGYAREMVAALAGHASGAGVRALLAHTSDANPASTRVLLACGFRRIGPGEDPGTIRYRKELAAAAGAETGRRPTE